MTVSLPGSNAPVATTPTAPGEGGVYTYGLVKNFRRPGGQEGLLQLINGTVNVAVVDSASGAVLASATVDELWNFAVGQNTWSGENLSLSPAQTVPDGVPKVSSRLPTPRLSRSTARAGRGTAPTRCVARPARFRHRPCHPIRIYAILNAALVLAVHALQAKSAKLSFLGIAINERQLPEGADVAELAAAPPPEAELPPLLPYSFLSAEQAEKGNMVELAVSGEGASQEGPSGVGASWRGVMWRPCTRASTASQLLVSA